MSNGFESEDFISLTDKAYQRISLAIANLELKPGETLTQDRLAKWLSISRTPVREALRRLEQEGIIHTVPGRGLVVKELTIKDVEDMLELLRLLDPYCAYLAAQRRTDEQARRLAELAQRLMRAAEERDVEAWSITDKPYHEIILEASGNVLLRQTIQDMRKRLHRISINSATRPERLLACTREHMAVAQAIVEGDAEAAQQLMRDHIEAMSASVLTLIRSYIVPIRGERF
ncbi:MAG: GntR family transcriptional regulator [Herpetosiphonaceae bacterium]|nr:MAG: GntR family transcriptional regulator [Herpetosiphonaceae bacterium]